MDARTAKFAVRSSVPNRLTVSFRLFLSKFVFQYYVSIEYSKLTSRLQGIPRPAFGGELAL